MPYHLVDASMRLVVLPEDKVSEFAASLPEATRSERRSEKSLVESPRPTPEKTCDACLRRHSFCISRAICARRAASTRVRVLRRATVNPRGANGEPVAQPSDEEEEQIRRPTVNSRGAIG